jgi:hypothetical protein
MDGSWRLYLMILRWVNPLLRPLEGVGPGYIDFTLIVISISNCLTLKQAAPFMKLAYIFILFFTIQLPPMYKVVCPVI